MTAPAAAVPAPPAAPGAALAALLDALGPCHLADAAGAVVAVNRPLRSLLEAHGEPLPVALPQHLVRRVLRQAEGVRAALVLRRGAAERQFRVVHRRIDGAGGAAQILSVLEETTREHEALAANRRTRDRAGDLLRIVSDWVWEMDPAWRITFNATRSGDLLGRRAADLVGTALLDIGAFEADPARPRARLPGPRQRAAFHDALFRARGAGDPAGGPRDRLFAVSAVPMFDDHSGAFQGFRCAAADVTERQAAQADAAAARAALEATLAELEQRNRELSIALDAARSAATAKAEFLAMMSHELRTPLNAVIGFSEIMQMEAFGPLGNARYVGYTADVLGSARYLLRLINDILDMVKLENGRMELLREPVGVAAALDAACRLVGEQARRKSIALAAAVDPALRISADPTRLHQLLLNLLANAVKFTPEGGRIAASAAREDGLVAIRIRDTGIGIPADKLELVFEPFRQADSSLARKHEGTGLGLPIARAIAEQHGGRLSLESAPGEGTTAIVLLPAADD